MLANLLAVVVGIGSAAFYLAAFILPEVHRRSDFFWSGVGMFYAVVLWYCARQMNGAILLGQTASVGLLLWLGYQTLRLRRETTPAAQQTPIRLGKSERDRTTVRPIAKDYEFVEDGIEDAVDQEPDPDSPILIKPAADEFALKMVVPAAIPKSSRQQEALAKTPAPETPATNPKPKQEKSNPLAAIGIFAGWLKEVITPQKKESKPMIELPPRPPSIPKTDIAKTANASDKATQLNKNEQSEVAKDTDTSLTPPSSVKEIAVNPEPDITKTAPPPPSVTAHQDNDDEDSNWPDDEFWD